MTEHRPSPDEVLQRYDRDCLGPTGKELGCALREALRQRDAARDGLIFYALGVNWMRHDGIDAKMINDDRGWRARQALNKSDSGEGVG